MSDPNRIFTDILGFLELTASLPIPDATMGDAETHDADGVVGFLIVGRPGWAAVVCMLPVLSIGLTVFRIVSQYQTPGPFDPARQGLCDFHNGIYFPATALLDGVSPYGQSYARSYPVARSIPFFSPGILALHAPLTWLPLRVAEKIYTIINIGMLMAIAAIAAAAAGMPRRLDVISCVALGLVISRGGHITIFDGYFTFELILATILAIHWAGVSPWKAALALAIVSAKPTYILPLGFLLLARGNYRALIYGAAISFCFAAIPFLWLSHQEGQGDVIEGFRTILTQIAETQETHRAQLDESPLYSWTRLDLLAVVAKWFQFDPGDFLHLGTMMVILAAPMFVLHRRRLRNTDDGLGGLTGGLILVATLVSLYHQSYDALLLVVPTTAIVIGRLKVWANMPIPLRAGLTTLAMIPAFNYLSTRLFLMNFGGSSSFYVAVTSISGVSLGLLLIALTAWGWGHSRLSRLMPSPFRFEPDKTSRSK